MLPVGQEKKQLIESMKKLTHHISNNKKRQEEIFKTLSKHDVVKILSNLTDENQYLRRISALLLTELFYNNQKIKEKFIHMLQIAPQQGRICLSQIPDNIQRYPATLKKCLQLMKSPLKSGEYDKFCWVINIDKKVLSLQNMDYKRYSSFTFLDPSRNIYGFYYSTAGQQSFQTEPSESIRTPSKVQHKRKQQRSAEKSVRSIDSSRSQKRDSVSNSSFYKNYIQGRNRRKPTQSSSASYKEFYEKRELNRPSTSRNSRDLNPSNMSSAASSRSKNISTYGSGQHNMSVNLNGLGQYGQGRTMRNREKDPHDQTDKGIGFSIKDNYRQNYQHLGHREKLSSKNESIDMVKPEHGNLTLRNNNSTGYKQTGYSAYRVPKTERISDLTPYSRSNRVHDSISSGVNMSLNSNSNSKYPDSTRSSYAEQQDKFYKRVKEVLKK